MIKSWEELSEVLAEFENRISYLELSANGTLVHSLEERIKELEKMIEALKIPEWNRRQWDAVSQLRAGYINLQGKVYEHIDASIKVGKERKTKPESELREIYKEGGSNQSNGSNTS